MNHSADFNGDLMFGKQGESELEKILGSVEVKSDRQVGITGNVWVEFESYGHPSGIATSNAKYWAFVFADDYYDNRVVILIETKRLRLHMQLWATSISSGGDNNSSKGYIIPRARLLS